MFQAVMLDRDGVINRERADYVKCWREFEFLPGALSALARLADLPKPIVVISNQSAIGRGLVNQDTVDAVHRHMKSIVEICGGRIDTFYVCPHHPDDRCRCRKPEPGLLLQAARDYNLDLSECVFVGDTPTDFQAAEAVGCQSILVSTGRQGPRLRSMYAGSMDVTIVQDLSAAVSLILDDRSDL